jgi:hypothetical protein
MAKTKGKRGPGRPRLSGNGKGASPVLRVRHGIELGERLDKWRKAQPGKPARSEAARQLMAAALTAAGF